MYSGGDNNTVQPWQTLFPALLTAVTEASGTFRYTWTEQSFDPSTGEYEDADARREGDSTKNILVEVNNREIDVPSYAWVRQRGVVEGYPFFEFNGAPASGTSGGSLTVEAADGNPSYTGITTLQFDQLDGFTFDLADIDTVRIDMALAASGTVGNVNVGPQTWTGCKTIVSNFPTYNTPQYHLMYDSEGTGYRCGQYLFSNTVATRSIGLMVDLLDPSDAATGAGAVCNAFGAIYQETGGQTGGEACHFGVANTNVAGGGFANTVAWKIGMTADFSGSSYFWIRNNLGSVIAGDSGTDGAGNVFMGGICTTVGAGGGGGTVTSVDLAVPAGFTVAGNPVTTSGTITIGGTLAATAGGTGLASYAKGDLLVASGAAFLARLAVGTDGLPLLADSSTTTGLAWSPVSLSGGAVTGTLTATRGGTGLASYAKGDLLVASGAAALVRLAAGSDGQILQADSSTSSGLKWAAASAASGTVTLIETGAGLEGGPITASGTVSVATNGITDDLFRQSAGLSVVGNATNSTADVADITAGSDHQALRRSGSTIGFGALDISQSAAVTGTLPTTRGGTGLTSYTTGDLLVASGSTLTRLASGTHGYVLTAASGEALGLKWAAAGTGSGDVTAAASLTDDAIVRGDGGAKGVQTSAATISDAGQLTVVYSDAGTTDSVPTVLTLTHRTSGTPGLVFGHTTKYCAETTTTNDVEMGELAFAWSVPTHAARTSIFAIGCSDAAGSREVIAGGANGGDPTISFLGATRAERQTGDVGTALVTFGLMSGTPTYNLNNGTGVLGESKGGTGNTTYTPGMLLAASGPSTLSKLASGTHGYVLTAASGEALGMKWSAAPGLIAASYVVTSESTASTSPVDLATTQHLSFTLDDSTDIVATVFAVVSNNNAGNNCNLTIDVDGSDTTFQRFCSTATNVRNASGGLKTTLASGSHTIKMQFGTSANTATFRNRLITVERCP